MEPVTSNEPSIRIMAGDPGSCHLLKSMIARAHSRQDHVEAKRLMEVRNQFHKWINHSRLHQARAQEIVDEAQALKEPGVQTGGEEEKTSSPVLSVVSPDNNPDRSAGGPDTKN